MTLKKRSYVVFAWIKPFHKCVFLTLQPSVSFPQEFEAWVNDTAEHGFVVVSFGAGVKYLSQDITCKLAAALARLPQRVVWR